MPWFRDKSKTMISNKISSHVYNQVIVTLTLIKNDITKDRSLKFEVAEEMVL